MEANTEDFFIAYKGRKIALYGLGTETEKALKNLKNTYEIVGLLDGFKEEGKLYEMPVISLFTAMERGVKLIIVVARPGSCRAITKRIGGICRENGIGLMDIRGKDLLAEKRQTYDFLNVPGVTKAELREKIQKADVVSFDLFDTLVMRQTLYSDDVAEYVNYRLEKKGIIIKDFCKRRLESEKDLSKVTAPTLTEIYRNMFSGFNVSEKVGITAQQLADLEWEIDLSLIIPREEVCGILKEAVAVGKRVYIVSDTYYGKKQLKEILEKCGITEYTDILASSDYQTSKTRDLYMVLKNKEKVGKCLHIGDDIVTDIECAQTCGFETCRLLSGVDLLEAVGNLGFADYMDFLPGRLKIGMFTAKIFNSPFQFEEADRRIRITKAYDIGYLICAPVISDFVLWFHRHMEKQAFQGIWFCARDGYLIKKLYQHLLKSLGREDRTEYFLISRIAAIRAGIQGVKDIRYVDEMKFSGTLEEEMRERFGMEVDDIPKDDISDSESGLMRYKAAILESARTARINYKKYMERLKPGSGDIAFFDFVAKGTGQMYAQRLTEHHLKGFYFLWIESESMKDKGLDICSFYGQNEEPSCAIYDNYYILETILTSPYPSVNGFDETGHPVYAAETRRDKDIRCFERVQEGILDYFKAYIALCPDPEKAVSKELDEFFLKLVHEVKITDSDFLDLVVEDTFFNRMTKITDVF